MPDLDHLLGYSATYSDLRLEDCVDPAAAIAEDAAQIFQMTSSAGADSDEAYFSLTDLTRFAGRLDACLIGFRDRTLVPAEAADRWLLIDAFAITGIGNFHPDHDVGGRRIDGHCFLLPHGVGYLVVSDAVCVLLGKNVDDQQLVAVL